jgi:tripartite-type tricarboxylate transporter receptor subunit TctC
MKRLFVSVLAMSVLAGAAPLFAQQAYPSKPIVVVVGSAAGGLADFGARLYAEVVGRGLGQRVVVENRPGAGGIIAAEYVKSQPADGYTLVQIGSGLPEALPSQQTLPFDPIKDFSYVTPLFKTDTYLIIRADLGPNTMAEYVAMAKSRPAGVTAGDTGLGSPPSLAMNIVRFTSTARIVHVHYRANSEVMSDLSTGRLDSSNVGFQVFRPLYEGGKIKVLAINANTRSKRFADVPTFAEAGYPGTAVSTWWGLLGPANIPKAVVDRLNAEFERASRDPDLVAKLAEQDIETVSALPQDFLSSTQRNQADMAKVIKRPDFVVE